MKQGELKRRITEYLAMGMSEFKEKGDQGEGLFVTHLVKIYKIRRIINRVIDAKRQMIKSTTMTSDMQMAEIVCLHISMSLVRERYNDICHYQGMTAAAIDIKTATDFLNYAFTTLGLDVTLDGRNVIDKYYQLNDSKKTDDTISMLELHIPHGSTNGDVFKAIFPHDYMVTDLYTTCAKRGAKMMCDKWWWNAPYEGCEDID